jgi:CheY-like chemotaxis protein
MDSNRCMARVLVVDDSAGLREIMSIGLRASGHDVAEAPDGRRALELQRAQAYEVIVTDLFMPEMDGIETIQSLRQEFPDVAIVAISGVPTKTGADFLEVAEKLGADRVLRKPFTIPELVAAVEAVRRGR